MKKITRFVLVGDGVEMETYENMRYDVQDDGQTLKVFREGPLSKEQDDYIREKQAESFSVLFDDPGPNGETRLREIENLMERFKKDLNN